MIIGIDPGPTESAYTILNDDGTVNKSQKIDNFSLLQMLGEYGIAGEHICIEMIASYGMAVGKEVFETCVWIGRFMQRYNEWSCIKPQRVTRKEIANHVCGSPRANDSNVRQAMLDRYGEKGTRSNPGPLFGFKADMFASLAVSTYAFDNQKVLWN